MSDPLSFTIRAVEEQDREWILDFISSSWGGDMVVVNGEAYFPHDLPGFVALNQEDITIGLVTYRIFAGVCEIITLNSLVKKEGVGSKLITAVALEASKAGCHKLSVTTTNDNQLAIDFYNKRGFKIKEIRKGAVRNARKIKPGIPEISPTGIPIEDEWEFEKLVSQMNKED
jgi:N-acetylglutamate synthase-like GNAT family acetyltransferase